MPKSKRILSFKEEVDQYFITNYPQLLLTTKKIISKNRSRKQEKDLDAQIVLTYAYEYIITNENNILAFSQKHNKTLSHTIYSFVLNYIDKLLSIWWTNSKMRNDLLKQQLTVYCELEDAREEDVTIKEYYEHNIYTHDFIDDFYKSLDKLDAICFQVYYYEGIETAKDFANHFNISLSSAYASINKLKKLLKEYIETHKIN